MIDDLPDDDNPAAPNSRYTRRLDDKTLIAFHHACDQQDFEVARRLIDTLEFMVWRGHEGSERRARADLVAAYERLWLLQHPEPLEC